jgi:capsular exopolysaccharide synthesis family protein
MTDTHMHGGLVAGAATAPSDHLLQIGALTDEQARLVAEQQARTGEGFDQAAVTLGLATADDVALARQQLQGNMALQLQPSTDISDEIVVLSDPASPRAEALRLLRTQIIAQHIGAGRRAFAVTGAVDGAGASYIAANLAAALSQVGIKTLLVDANMRNPRIDAIYGIDPSGPGLSTYLSLQANRPERVVYPDVLPHLSIIPSGPPVARPQELLSGVRFRSGVDILLRQYDVALFDTPATNENADALTVAGVLGYALVVARRDHSFVRDVQVLTQQIGAARASVIGSVLNEYQ